MAPQPRENAVRHAARDAQGSSEEALTEAYFAPPSLEQCARQNLSSWRLPRVSEGYTTMQEYLTNETGVEGCAP